MVETSFGAAGEQPSPETDAHWSRVAELTRRIVVAGRKNEDRMVGEMCAAFDGAVEFAALEGRSIPEAIAGFFSDEDWGPGQALLKKMLGAAPVTVPAILPTMPEAARKLLRTTDENTSPAELETIAGGDPALAARLLGTANSARFGTRFEILRVRDAVMRLGVPESRKVLLAGCFGRLFASSSLRALWEHSQTVSEACWEIAELTEADREAAYVTGLLHDIGRLGFATFPAASRIAEQEWVERGFPLVYAESLVYARDHAAFGSVILKSWGLPAPTVEAVAFHHRPEVADSRLALTAFLAEDLVARAEGTPQEDLWVRMRRTIAIEKTCIDPARLDALLAKEPRCERASA